ncbi:helix-turn-helix domain-containing protein [Vallitalea guaymasensis]|uniref:helix-turn-helix domain-containing protein n=1 Tax=Vallitalea guaymasensis TaxID=1185412 RepID=UPI0023560A2F|nr:helix-turn-helix domain-containing protein [Vallitalea guaymasensis]
MEVRINEFKVAGKIKTTVSAKLIYMLLNKLADKEGSVQISQKKLSKILGLHKTTVRKNLWRLEKSGYIYIRSRYTDDGGRLANEYIVR